MVALSLAKAEHTAKVAALKKLKLIKGVLLSMDIAHSGAMDIYWDSKYVFSHCNQSCV